MLPSSPTAEALEESNASRHDAASAPTPDATGYPREGLHVIDPEDLEAHKRLAQRVARVPWFWSDHARQNVAEWYWTHFCSPGNLVVTLGDDMQGLLAFLHTVPGWRTQLYAARFDADWPWPRALVYEAAQLAILALNVLVIDAFIDPENHEALLSAPRWGFQRRGYIARSVQYNGVWRPAWWLELHRDTLGVPQAPLESLLAHPPGEGGASGSQEEH